MAKVYLIPTLLAEDALHALPAYITDAIRSCQVLYVEHERTARRFLKKLDKDFVIDQFRWHSPDPQGNDWTSSFLQDLRSNQTIGIMSEAGCPGIADPGQDLVALAHEQGAMVKPLVGPNSILLALMASGMNGQQFEFVGYLPVDAAAREKKIRELEMHSAKTGSAKICIETPYRNQALAESLIKTMQPGTKLCIAVNLTAASERIQTKKVSDWRKEKPELAKVPAIFLWQAGSV